MRGLRRHRHLKCVDLPLLPGAEALATLHRPPRSPVLSLSQHSFCPCFWYMLCVSTYGASNLSELTVTPPPRVFPPPAARSAPSARLQRMRSAWRQRARGPAPVPPPPTPPGPPARRFTWRLLPILISSMDMRGDGARCMRCRYMTSSMRRVPQRSRMMATRCNLPRRSRPSSGANAAGCGLVSHLFSHVRAASSHTSSAGDLQASKPIRLNSI